MRPTSIPFVRSGMAILLAAATVPCAVAQSAAADVADAIRAQYKLSKFGRDSNGWAVVQAGTVLVLQQGGLLGIPPERMVFCAAKYEDGQMKAPGGLCAATHRNVSRYFQQGDKVYVLRIDENVKKEQISFRVVECDSCNGTNPPSFYKSEVVFQFPGGYLETAQPGPVTQTISLVFSVDKGDAQPAEGAPPTAPAASHAATAPPAPTAPPPPVAAPPPAADEPTQTIEIGQTVDQVVTALGQPQKIAKVGTKQIYFYKNLKVTFNNGKVSDVD
jgi:hypothetical protein